MLLTVAFRYGGIVLQFFILLILARNLNADDYGRYLLVLSVVLPTYFLVGFGVSEAFVRDAPKLSARGDDRRLAALAGATLAVAIASAVGIGLIGGLCAWLLPLDPMTVDVIAFIVTFLVANGLMFNAAQVFLGAGRQTLGAFFFYPAINFSLIVSAVPYVLMARAPTFHGIAIATSAAALLIASFALVLVKYAVHPARHLQQHVWHLARIGVRLSAARGLYAAGIWLPTFIAGVALTPALAGHLGTAGRLAVAVGAVMAAVRFAIRPSIVRSFDEGDHQAIKETCGRIATVTLVLALIALVTSVFAGRQLMGVTFGRDFAAAAPLLSTLLVAVVIEAYAGPVDEVLKMTGKEGHVVKIFGVAVPVTLCALFIASHWGVEAMAWVQVAYTASVFGAMIVVVHREWGIWLHPVIPKRFPIGVGQRQTS